MRHLWIYIYIYILLTFSIYSGNETQTIHTDCVLRNVNMPILQIVDHPFSTITVNRDEKSWYGDFAHSTTYCQNSN